MCASGKRVKGRGSPPRFAFRLVWFSFARSAYVRVFRSGVGGYAVYGGSGFFFFIASVCSVSLCGGALCFGSWWSPLVVACAVDL